MPTIEQTLDELKYPLMLLVGRHLADSSVSDEEIRSLRDQAVSLVMEICDQPRNFFFRANLSDQNINKKLTTGADSAISSQRKLKVAGAATPIAIPKGKKEAVIKLLGAAKTALSINEVMAELLATGHADESQRGTVLSMLRRLRLRDGLLDSPHEGNYQLSESGRNLYDQLGRTPVLRAK